MPSGPEQLRLRLTVLHNALIMIQLRHPGREELKDVTMALFELYKEYLLGDYCYGLRSSEDSGSLIPPWTLVLQYEHACFRYNGKGGCKQGAKCHFVHVCMLCFGKHPATQCPQKAGPAKDDAAKTASAKN